MLWQTLLGLTSTTALASGVAAWCAMSPASRVFGATFRGLRDGPGREGREVALTYDDGPGPHTAALLDVLARHDVRATFFVLGRHARARPELVRAAAGAGHDIGNHSLEHPNLALAGPRRVREEVQGCSALLATITGAPPRLFRPPFGGRRPDVLRVAREAGMTPVLWSATAGDWRRDGGGQVAARAEAVLAGGDVLLLHDGDHRDPLADRHPTVEATALLVPRLRAAGFTFVTISDMMSLQAPPPGRGGAPHAALR